MNLEDTINEDNEIKEGIKLSKIEIIDKYDKFEVIKKELENIANAFKILKKSGITRQVMIRYIHSKGIAMSTIEDVLERQQEFLNEIGLM